MTRRILVTSALPYANGPIHIGHLVEYIQTDIWVRFQRLIGNRCVYICADDTHGTAIMIRAKKEGRSEEELIADMSAQHQRDFADFHVDFDHYGSTNSEANREFCHLFWQALRDADLVTEKSIQQLYDPEAETFLADRFVRGTCPVSGHKNQPGDNCQCGATYSPIDLIDPKSTLSGATPEVRSAVHLFVTLEKLRSFLIEWIDNGDALQKETANYLKGFFLAEDKELRDWDISRPGPYFGFEIPDSPGNYWYVWFDAPIGYVSSTKEWCDANGESFDDWWRSESTEIHHFIGKDITYFHTLFWPGMLHTAGLQLPTKVHIHGFLNVGGEKMSKSTGTLISAETYRKHSDPDYLRYFYATKLTQRVEDLDLGIDEFVEKVNSDLVGKVVNLASRVGKFAKHTGLAETYPDDGGLFENAAKAGDLIAEAYEVGDYSRAMRLIMELADAANPFVEHAKPWEMKKDPERQDELRDVVTVALNLFRQLTIYLAPVLPTLAKKCDALLGEPITSWDQSKTPLLGTAVAKFQRMMERIQPEDLQKMIEESKEEAAEEAAAENRPTFADSDQPLKDEPIADEITIDDFVKVDFRVARVLTAEHVPEANKLLKLTLGLGGDETRQVFAGIKAAYEPESLVGRLVVMVANLKPRKMRFGLSEGMVCASGPGGEDVFLLSPDEGALPGQRVH
ncbi:methionine--tRNA ligase [Stieleria sp. ICT_E10.1]|uniref:methionine--tRNA ligase n=1 Tax=Stieleria sedimenti TaxID=2976331 RepID=UPI00217FCEEB|nr:methionine--tRNA ligase [Stieleria sedimenti]MCS7465540.1 methionine--tRNA ligase [Stieleria sedimenti]